MMRHFIPLSRLFTAFWVLGFTSARGASAQLPFDPASKPADSGSSKAAPAAGVALLFQLEAKAVEATASGGGKAFASFFADDAVALGNGQAPLVGHEAIARSDTWSPADFQLVWTPTAGQMSPSGDMGFTWGHYEATSKDATGARVTQKGRYMTIWKKQPDGSWKIELDSSANEPADAADCCKVP